MPRGAVPTKLEGVEFRVEVEDARFPIVRLTSDVPSEQRAGYTGPLYENVELLEQIAARANLRATLSGAERSIWSAHSWRFATQCLPGDVELLRDGLQRLLTGDQSALLVYLSSAMAAPQIAPELPSYDAGGFRR